ncbi:MAG: hypothetical protein ACERK9_05985 [Deltaproteobacteria bacterium]
MTEDRGQEIEVRGRRSEIRGQTTGVIFPHIEILLWELLFPT